MEKPRFHFTYTLPCKVICFLLAAILSVVIAAGGFISAYGMSDGWFDYAGRNFYESSLLDSMVHNCAMDIAWDYRWAEAIPADNINLLYVIYDENGKILAQNCDGERAVYVGSRSFDFSDDSSYGAYNKTLVVSCWLRSPMIERDRFYLAGTAYDWAYGSRGAIIAWTAAAAVAFCVCIILLLCGAGRKSGTEEVSPAWINRKVPLELHLAAAIFAAVLDLLGFDVCVEAIRYSGRQSVCVLAVVCAAACVAAMCVLCTHMLVCFASRVKAGKWWHNMLCYKILRWVWRAAKKLFGLAAALFRDLPLIWKSALVFCAAALINIILAIFIPHNVLAFLLLFLFDCALLAGVCLASAQMRRLQQGGQELSRGNVDYKINTEGMFRDFRRHAEDLNSVSEGMTNAVNERMKSERFKTELITNVSHDIKTPLTSIISYVDLLKKENITNEKALEYIEVIDRQSARLKKLTEDLVEASKASSGAVKLDMERVDVGELLRQSVGEYNERLTEAGLTTIMNLPEKPLPIMADGRRLWRIFENLLSNIRKYAMPGTRAYITAEGVHGGVFVTFRNISANELNISPSELMERFVRGDSSRSTEGSGLGLSIARSLTELMGGSFEIFLDGDLFKAVVSFPMLYEAGNGEENRM